jgi:hypothetical protein
MWQKSHSCIHLGSCRPRKSPTDSGEEAGNLRTERSNLAPTGSTELFLLRIEGDKTPVVATLAGCLEYYGKSLNEPNGKPRVRDFRFSGGKVV